MKKCLADSKCFDETISVRMGNAIKKVIEKNYTENKISGF